MSFSPVIGDFPIYGILANIEYLLRPVCRPVYITPPCGGCFTDGNSIGLGLNNQMVNDQLLHGGLYVVYKAMNPLVTDIFRPLVYLLHCNLPAELLLLPDIHGTVYTKYMCIFFSPGWVLIFFAAFLSISSKHDQGLIPQACFQLNSI